MCKMESTIREFPFYTDMNNTNLLLYHTFRIILQLILQLVIWNARFTAAPVQASTPKRILDNASWKILNS